MTEDNILAEVFAVRAVKAHKSIHCEVIKRK